MYEFNYSKSTTKKIHRILLLVFLLLPAPVILFGFYLSDFDLAFTLRGALRAMLITFCSFMVVLFVNRHCKQMKVLIDDKNIIKKCRKKSQTIPFKDIVQVKINRLANDELANILIVLKNKQKILLCAMENMDNLADLIAQNLGEHTSVQTKQSRLGHKHIPPLIIATVFITTFVFIIIHYVGLLPAFIPFFGFIVGLGILIFGPARKANLNTRWFEILMGIILIACSLFLTLCFLFPDFFNQI